MECRENVGVTLVELVTAVAIGSLLLALAVPGFIDLLRSNHLATQLNSFVRAISLSRSEAVKRNRSVYLCPASGGQCLGGGTWERGGVVFVDQDGDLRAAAHETIGTYGALASGYSLKPNIRTPGLRFYPDGRVRRLSGALPLSTFRLCARDAAAGNLAQRSREIVINASGRVRVQPGRERLTSCP